MSDNPNEEEQKSNVHKLFGNNPNTTVTGMPNPNVIDCLKELLVEAERGEINGFTFIGMTPAGPYLPVGGGYFTNVEQAYIALGILERLRSTILAGILMSESS